MTQYRIKSTTTTIISSLMDCWLLKSKTQRKVLSKTYAISNENKDIKITCRVQWSSAISIQLQRPNKIRCANQRTWSTPRVHLHNQGRFSKTNLSCRVKELTYKQIYKPLITLTNHQNYKLSISQIPKVFRIFYIMFPRMNISS